MNQRATREPLVTIGIPTYSRLGYLKEAVASAQAQTYANIEILISQNPHSNGDVRAAIADYCKAVVSSDQRIRYQVHARDLGPPANFNSIADAATGEYLTLIGDDDRLLPNAVERMVSMIGADTVLVFSNRYIMDANGQRLETTTLEFSRGYGRESLKEGIVPNPEVCAWQQACQTECSLVRTADFRRLRFREDLDMPDVLLWILLARAGGEFLFLPEYLSEYRLHADSTTGRGFQGFHELIRCLAGLPVSPEVAPYKRRLLRGLMHGAISKCLREGDTGEGQELVSNPYYPTGGRAQVKRSVMTLGTVLPRPLGAAMYKMLYAFTYGRAGRATAL